MFNFSFCNDCDLMTWEGYKNVHTLLNDLGLPAGDSFWLFDPSGGDMALFTHDLKYPGPKHDELLEEISNGNLDVLHSMGSYGSRFNGGFSPSRDLLIQALEYLKKHAKIPKIWSNHGDDQNIQNLGGAYPVSYHKGDEPDSECYILDTLLDYGFEYFWLDRLLIKSANTPYKIVSSEESRSGHKIKTFSRFAGNLDWAPNAVNLPQQLDDKNIDLWKKFNQDTILYQHWGCHHTADRWAFSPKGMPFSEASVNCLQKLAERFHNGEIKITRLYDLLVNDVNKTLVDEAQRIGLWAIADESSKKDNFYYNQYGKHGVTYFDSRISGMGVKGKFALDAGCGVGQWSFALSKKFEYVYGVDINLEACQILQSMTSLLRQDNPIFSKQNVTKLAFGDDFFDFISCYSVIFCVDTKLALKEFYRVLSSGGVSYIGLNADGWYEYLVDERFKNSDDEERKQYVVPLWHATLARIGGENFLLNFLEKCTQSSYVIPEKIDQTMARAFLSQILPKTYFEKYKYTFEHYSDYIVTELANQVLITINRLKSDVVLSTSDKLVNVQKFSLLDSMRKLIRKVKGIFNPNIVVLNNSVSTMHVQAHIPWVNRAFLPDEIQQLATEIGFKSFRWGTDASLTVDSMGMNVKPLYEADYRGQLSVWECLLYK